MTLKVPSGSVTSILSRLSSCPWDHGCAAIGYIGAITEFKSMNDCIIKRFQSRATFKSYDIKRWGE